MATIFERIRKVTVDQLGVKEEEVTPSSSFVDDLGADSLDLVELIMALEEEFTIPERKVSIPDEDAEKIITVQDAMNYIHDKGVTDNEPPKSASRPAGPAHQAPKAAPARPAQNRPAAGRPGTQKPQQHQGQSQNQPRQGQGQRRPPQNHKPPSGQQPS